jgi:hypothetical protein
MPVDAKSGEGSIRDAIRWGLFLATVATFGFRLVPLARDFRAWRGAVRLGDASEAEGLRTHLAADAISLLIVLGLGLALFFVLRPPGKSQP